MTDIPNEANSHQHSHNHTHVEQTEKLYSTNFVIFSKNFDFLRSKGEFTFS